MLTIVFTVVVLSIHQNSKLKKKLIIISLTRFSAKPKSYAISTFQVLVYLSSDFFYS